MHNGIKKITGIILCFAIFCMAAGCTKTVDADGVEVTKSILNITKATTTEKPKPTEKLVALTFDDGPYSPVTEKILDTLEQYNAKATFFVVGNRVDTYSKSVKRASDMGCEIGSHTFTHKNLKKLKPAAIKSEIDKSNAAIKKVIGKDISLVRPPEGATDDTVKKVVEYPLIMWSVDSEDWHYKNADKDYKEVMNDTFDGCIILMHDLYPATAQAVARIVPALMVEGYRFVTVSDLMEIRGVELKKGQKFFNAKPTGENAAPASSIPEPKKKK